jgi:hypothetical protein
MRRLRIYGLCSAADGAVRYVGSTALSLPARRTAHLRAASQKGDSPVQQWIRSVGARQLRIVLLIARGGAEAERAEITRRVALGEPLLNVNDGGPCSPTQRLGLKCSADGERHHRADEVAADLWAVRSTVQPAPGYAEAHPGKQIADAAKAIRPREPLHPNTWRDQRAARLAAEQTNQRAKAA